MNWNDFVAGGILGFILGCCTTYLALLAMMDYCLHKPPHWKSAFDVLDEPTVPGPSGSSPSPQEQVGRSLNR